MERQGCDVTEEIIQKSGSVHRPLLTHASYVAYLLRLKASSYLTHENSCYAFTSLAVWKLE